MNTPLHSFLTGGVRIASRWGGLACDTDWRWRGDGCRDLSNNQLATLPESACDTDWRWCDDGCRDLSHNQLATLPESFGDLKVGGDL